MLDPPEIDITIMLITASIGLFINIIMAKLLHSGMEGSLNGYSEYQLIDGLNDVPDKETDKEVEM